MNAVIYGNFSSQNLKEQAIKGQIKVCEEYAKEKGYTITDIYIDTNSREQFEQMIKDSSKKNFQAVVVDSMDRFARDCKERILKEDILKENEVQLILAKEDSNNNKSEMLLREVVENVIKHYKELEEKAKKERIVNEG